MSAERCYHLDTTAVRPIHFKGRDSETFYSPAVMQELHSVNKRQIKPLVIKYCVCLRVFG